MMLWGYFIPILPAGIGIWLFDILFRIVFASFYNRLYIEKLLRTGYVPSNDDSKETLTKSEISY